MIRKILFLMAALFAGPAFAGGLSVDQLAKPPADAKVWTITSSGGDARHGQVSLWVDKDGTHWSRIDFNLRGFVSEIDEQNRFAADGTLSSMVVRGSTTSGDAAETYAVKDGTYTFKSPVDHGTGKTAPNLEYVSFGGTFDSFTFLLDAMLKSPTHAIDLLPSGRASIAPLTTLDVTNGTEKKTLTAYAVTGFGFSPFPLWFDGDKFFGQAGVINFLPAGWEKSGDAMSKAQDAALAKLAPAQMALYAKTPPGPVAFKNVKLYDSDAQAFRDGMTVVVAGGRIVAVGPAAETEIPAGAQVIDGTGKTLVPGLWGQPPALRRRFHRPAVARQRHHLGARSRQPAGRADGAQEAHRRRRAPRPAHRAVALDRRSRPLHRAGRRRRAQCARGAGGGAPRQA